MIGREDVIQNRIIPFDGSGQNVAAIVYKKIAYAFVEGLNLEFVTEGSTPIYARFYGSVFILNCTFPCLGPQCDIDMTLYHPDFIRDNEFKAKIEQIGNEVIASIPEKIRPTNFHISFRVYYD